MKRASELAAAVTTDRTFRVELIALAFIVAVSSPANADDALPECPMQRMKEISFRSKDSKDVLEVSIGMGPCYAATLSIVVRTEFGEVLYSYVERFKRHTAVHWEAPDLPDVAREFVDRTMDHAMGRAADLTPQQLGHEDSGAYYCTLLTEPQKLDELRKANIPLLGHPTHYEEWRYVIYDERNKQAQVILECGV